MKRFKTASPLYIRDFYILALDSRAKYKYINIETNVAAETTGKTLMEKGISIELPAKPAAAAITYKRSETIDNASAP
jgi:hypothetical protein